MTRPGARGAAFAAALVGAIIPGGLEGAAVHLAAQEDFRSADADRPILVEDAIPLKFREWEIELGARGTVSEGEDGLLGIVELKTGLFRNAQVGLELETGIEGRGAGADAAGGVEALGLHALYAIRRETETLPAFAVRADVKTPGVGALGHDDWSAGIKGIATRSFGRARLHGNGGYMVSSEADGGDYWRLGLGFDFPVGLFSKAVLGDVYAEIPTSEGRSRVWAEVGTRWQVSNWSVLDLGLATRIDGWEDGNANIELVVGLSRVFGIAGLTRVPPYPDPSIP